MKSVSSFSSIDNGWLLYYLISISRSVLFTLSVKCKIREFLKKIFFSTTEHGSDSVNE